MTFGTCKSSFKQLASAWYTYTNNKKIEAYASVQEKYNTTFLIENSCIEKEPFFPYNKIVHKIGKENKDGWNVDAKNGVLRYELDPGLELFFSFYYYTTTTATSTCGSRSSSSRRRRISRDSDPTICSLYIFYLVYRVITSFLPEICQNWV